MKSIFKNLVVRTLSGIIFISVMIAAILWEPPYLFGIVFLLIAGLGLREFYTLSAPLTPPEGGKEVKVMGKFSILSGCILFIAFFLYAFRADPNLRLYSPILNFGLYILCVVFIFLMELFRKEKNPVQNIAVSLMGHIYVVIPFAFICLIENEHRLLALAFFITIWISDTGAYLAGICFGRHKMFERVSPKKTWEGLAGGMVFALITGWVFSLVTTTENGELLKLWQWLVFAWVVFAFGTLGDLVESLFKRSLNTKDSGFFMPGHGGLLDRFDSTLMAAPIAWLFLEMVK